MNLENVVVHCTTLEKAKQVLTTLFNMGYKFGDDIKVKNDYMTQFHVYKENTAYHLFPNQKGINRIYYGNVRFAKEDGKTVLLDIQFLLLMDKDKLKANELPIKLRRM